MDPSLLKSDCVARCVDNAIYIVLGVLVVVFAPRQLHKKMENGKITKEKAKTMSKAVWPLGCLLIGYGIFRIFVG